MALNAAILLYVWVTYFKFRSSLSTPFPSSHPLTLTLALALAAMAVAAAVAARWIPGLLVPEQRMREFVQDADPTTLARNAQTGAVDTERLARIKTLLPHQQRMLAVAQASFTPFILRLALNESIALLGFVLSLRLQQFWPVVPFAVAALALNLFVSPRLDPDLTRVLDSSAPSFSPPMSTNP